MDEYSSERPESYKFPCGGSRNNSACNKRIPAELRLNFQREVPVDKIKQSVPKPKGYLPPTYLPTWPELPLEAKLPGKILPSSIMIMARGHVGQNILHKPKYYTIYDPKHQERVIPEEYNALHDPHAKGYLQKPSVRKQLIKQGLITTDGKVLCSVKSFNTYRKYLSTQYNDEVTNKLQDQHAKELALHKTDVELKQFFEKNDGENFHKARNARQKQRKANEDRLQRLVQKQQAYKERDAKWKQEQLEKRCEKQRLAYSAEQSRRHKLSVLREQFRDKQVKAYIMQIHKENVVADRVQNNRCRTAEARRQFLLAWMCCKWHFQEERLKVGQDVKETIQNCFTEKARRRQKRIEHHRAILPQIIERQRIERNRVWNLVKKFFYRWLNKVRERRARIPDADHQSLWDGNFEKTVEYLHKESGFEKLDDFIMGMGLAKLKRDINAANNCVETEDPSQYITDSNNMVDDRVSMRNIELDAEPKSASKSRHHSKQRPEQLSTNLPACCRAIGVGRHKPAIYSKAKTPPKVKLLKRVCKSTGDSTTQNPQQDGGGSGSDINNLSDEIINMPDDELDAEYKPIPESLQYKERLTAKGSGSGTDSLVDEIINMTNAELEAECKAECNKSKQRKKGKPMKAWKERTADSGSSESVHGIKEATEAIDVDSLIDEIINMTNAELEEECKLRSELLQHKKEKTSATGSGSETSDMDSLVDEIISMTNAELVGECKPASESSESESLQHKERLTTTESGSVTTDNMNNLVDEIINMIKVDLESDCKSASETGQQKEGPGESGFDMAEVDNLVDEIISMIKAELEAECKTQVASKGQDKGESSDSDFDELVNEIIDMIRVSKTN